MMEIARPIYVMISRANVTGVGSVGVDVGVKS